jgi:PEGA domain
LTPQQLSVVPDPAANAANTAPRAQKTEKKTTASKKDNTWMLPAALLGIVFLAVLLVALSTRDEPASNQTVAASDTPAKVAATTTPQNASDAKPIAPVAAVADAAQGSAASPELATVSLAIYPWGEVWVNGRSVGVSPPLNELKLKPGQHAIEIRNPSATPYRETITLDAGDTTKRIRHKFQ